MSDDKTKDALKIENDILASDPGCILVKNTKD